MKRDMELVSELLLFAEKNCKAGHGAFLKFSEFDAADDEGELREHISLMEEKSLLKAALPSWEDDVGIGDLTWSGHDFLDSIRDPEIWNKTKEVADKAGGFTLELLGDIAKGLIKTQIEKHTGVEI